MYRHEDSNGRFMRRNHDCCFAGVKAHRDLSPHGVADGLLRYFASMITAMDHKNVTNFGQIAGSWVEVSRAVRNRHCYPCDTKLFDWFCRFCDRYYSPNYVLGQYERAWLKMYHPTTPNPWPTFNIITQDPTSSRLVNNAKVERNVMGHELLRPAFLLRLQGALTEAERAEIILEEHFRSVFHARDSIIADLERDPKLYELLNSNPTQPEENVIEDVARELFEFRLQRKE
ncbi:hypothetical protein Q7P37_002750 [Cladosporium fusiforme]